MSGAVITCDKCGRELNEKVETVWRLVSGWEKKREQGGTNYLALRLSHEEFRCNGCMTLMLDGLDPGQKSLL